MLATIVDWQRKFYVLNDLKQLKWLLNFCIFSGTFLDMFRIFLFVKTCLWTFFFLQRVFFIKIQKTFQFQLATCRPCINFYFKSFSASTNAVVPRFIHLIRNIYEKYWSVNLILHILWTILRKMSEYLFVAVFSINKFIRNIS